MLARARVAACVNSPKRASDCVAPRSDFYFVYVLDTVAPRAAVQSADQEALLATVQRRAAQQGADTGWQLPCPACEMLVTGMSPSQAARDANLDAVLTVRPRRIASYVVASLFMRRSHAPPLQPCRLVCFERDCQLPPLYMRAGAENEGATTSSAAEASPLCHWELAWGVGPPALVAECAGGALPRASLARFGVRSPPLPADVLPSRAEAAARVRALDAAISRLPPSRATEMNAAWVRLRPLFECWPEVEAELLRIEAAQVE